jgi:archaellum biogenesis ATPase FlaH
LIETIILQNLIHNHPYGREVFPHLKSEFFDDDAMRVVFDVFSSFCWKYNKFPTVEAIALEVSQKTDINPTTFDKLTKGVNGMKGVLDCLEEKPKEETLPFLIDQTEKHCQEQALNLAILKAYDVIKDKTGKLKIQKGAIPDMFQKALSVSFDTRVGHDYIAEAALRFSAYHETGVRLPTNITYLNKVTRGGWAKKTLNIFMAGTGVGKSLVMGSLAAGHLMDGKNVLYISGELSEMTQVGERIDANLLNTPIDQIALLPKDIFLEKVKAIGAKTNGRLVIKEYPAAQATVNDFRILLNELKIRKKFVPDVIFVDYVNIFASCRIKNGDNTNAYVKAVAEELRGFATEFDVPIITATQTNRGGQNNTELELTDIAESFGLAQTADLLIALMNDEDLEKKGQIMMKQLKSRFGDPSKFRKFVVGIDRSRMRIFDTDGEAQSGYINASMTTVQKEIDKRKPNKGNKFGNFK